MKTLGFKMSLQMIVPGEDDGVLIVEDPQSSDATAVHGFCRKGEIYQQKQSAGENL